jgi:hypothetical protein
LATTGIIFLQRVLEWIRCWLLVSSLSRPFSSLVICRSSLSISVLSDEPDILDESIAFFRANVLFRTFQSQGPADLTLAYFTAFIAEVLRFFQKQKTKEDAKKKLTELSMSQNFPIPGEKNFALAGFFSQPASRAESDSFRQYFRQSREEICNRLVDIAYDEKGNQNKWSVAHTIYMRGPQLPPLDERFLKTRSSSPAFLLWFPSLQVDQLLEEKVHEHHIDLGLRQSGSGLEKSHR